MRRPTLSKICKIVSKGSVQGVAQTLGTEYFPAAYDRRLNLLSCFADDDASYVNWSAGSPAVAVRSQSAIAGEPSLPLPGD